MGWQHYDDGSPQSTAARARGLAWARSSAGVCVGKSIGVLQDTNGSFRGHRFGEDG